MKLCTDCQGASTVIEWNGEESPYTCPVCGGSGKSKDMIEKVDAF